MSNLSSKSKRSNKVKILEFNNTIGLTSDKTRINQLVKSEDINMQNSDTINQAHDSR